MGTYDSSIKLAQRLIKSKGQVVTLRTFANAAGNDPDQPWKSGENVPTNVSVDAVFLNYAQKYIDGEFIKSGDQQVLLPPTATNGSAITPTLNGLIIRGTETWKIVAIKPLNPNGEMVMYELQVRQ